ncbi:MAG: nodulation factor ABC transporter ATP-binding protein NodI [Thiobacillus sp. 63-78]|uniref:ATP-binding cassette domain-containing protein n=1 Tax=Thiobacillus sp. 63-78 TaxID=1895859 RepID=UPI00086A0BCB|nr:ATP-binding cassette domain-containing protein [Thiobacillus sp. 63-78]MBN8763829.1 ATP-binding cassette domain-containing protein [Thiobacillus sp.]MBN8772918.1 ATP-binding cassette domain-containing protein [Thiobacillus sp.]ODV10679.1 MAG: nodulation factor ABC transporter ATP-binding protein NodI [Thiobacillus sp. SCN 64-317]OJZ14887.1 MAG: nodulation factor ABC transporter ATP-binding protein NodI [Thiobacillus sp. 63-78]
MLKVRGLTKRYGATEVVRNLDLTVQRGECFGLLGPNGAGKTTTLRLLLGLIEPDAGSIELAGIAVPQCAREARMKIGVVPQMDNLDPDFSVRENLLAYGRYFGMSKAAITARVPELLDFAGLASKADARIVQLSGGMKRRLTLARALVHDPDILFLDEPTTGLDPQARHLIWQGLRRLTGAGKTIVLTTHFMDEAERLADRLAILDHGRVVAEGAPRALIESHIEPAVVEVFGEGLADWTHAHAAALCQRFETVGETLFCYTDSPDTVIGVLKQTPALRYLHRPSNLEDVFLKLTGRDLRD